MIKQRWKAPSGVPRALSLFPCFDRCLWQLPDYIFRFIHHHPSSNLSRIRKTYQHLVDLAEIPTISTMSSTDALSQTLKSITATKLTELSKQRDAFEAKKKTILNNASKEPTSQARVSVILEGLQKLSEEQLKALQADNDDSDVEEMDIGLSDDSLKNIKRFVLQSKYDPSVPTSLLTEWEQKLKRELEIQSVKHRHACFFGQLVTEWLENPQNADTVKMEVNGGEGETAMSMDSFEQVGRQEMHEQRKEWESLVFQAPNAKSQAIEKYLNELFMSTKASRTAVTELRKKVRKTGAKLRTNTSQFNTEMLKQVIKGVLNADGLTDEKRRILTEISTNESVIMEVADVLNMRMATLDEWSWPASGVPVEQRRALNGKYRVYMDEDLLDALLLHYIGMYWGVAFKDHLGHFFNSQAWKRSSKVIEKRDRDRREYFLGDAGADSESLHTERQANFQANYFMSQLPNSHIEGARDYNADNDSDTDAQKSAIEIKQALLHLLATESLIATSLFGNFTVIRSDFKMFGPSLSFDSIFTVLKFFGVSQEWINFFTRFLSAPLKFVHDGPRAQVQIRKRGVPINHVLSDFFGEMVLFCMDFAVNQRTNGSYLYRLHDDFWFWGQEDTCEKAWNAMTQFSGAMGIEFNEEKTGTARLNRDRAKPAVSKVLPSGDVRWAFLKLDAASGRFLIDQHQVDEHVVELKRQLDACKSVFAWVQAWNSYLARFFVTNFGKAAHCFGLAHVDMILDTFSRIQRKLFSDIGEEGVSNVTDYLRKVIKGKFGVDDLPDGFFYLPVNMGGLDLRNPFIPMFAIRETIYKDPRKKLEKAFDKDEEAYNSAKESFEKGERGGRTRIFEEGTFKDDEDKKTFMSLEEYNKYREETSSNLLNVYRNFLEEPREKVIDETPEVTAALQKSQGKEGDNAASDVWDELNSYEKWVMQLYATELTQKFGGLRIVDKAAVPLGVVNMLRSGKVKWQG
jgi:hypothetical protein